MNEDTMEKIANLIAYTEKVLKQSKEEVDKCKELIRGYEKDNKKTMKTLKNLKMTFKMLKKRG